MDVVGERSLVVKPLYGILEFQGATGGGGWA